MVGRRLGAPAALRCGELARVCYDILMTVRAVLSPEDPDVAVVREFFDCLERMDAEAGYALMTTDAVYQNVPLPPARGVGQVAQHLGFFMLVLSDFIVDSCEFTEGGSSPDGERTIIATRYDTLIGSGFRARFLVEGTFVIRDGRIASWVDRFSWPELLSAFISSFPDMVRHALDRIG